MDDDRRIKIKPFGLPPCESLEVLCALFKGWGGGLGLILQGFCGEGFQLAQHVMKDIALPELGIGIA